MKHTIVFGRGANLLLAIVLLAFILDDVCVTARDIFSEPGNTKTPAANTLPPFIKSKQKPALRSSGSLFLNPTTTDEEVQEAPSESILISTRFITNSTDYLYITCDSGHVESLISGYTFGVFGHAPPLLPDARSVPTPNRSAKPLASIRNQAKSNSNTSPTPSPVNEFNSYSGFMSSPGNILDSVKGNTGNNLNKEQYDMYNPHGVSSVDDLNWTSIYATVMVAFKVSDIPREITISRGVIATLSDFLGFGEGGEIYTSAAYSVGNGDSGPLYNAEFSADPDGSIVLSIDPDWYANTASARRTGKESGKPKFPHTRSVPSNSSQQQGTTSQGSVGSLDISSSEGDDVLAISLNFVVPRTEDDEDSSLISSSDSSNGTDNGLTPTLIYRTGKVTYVANNVSASFLFSNVGTPHKNTKSWYITLTIVVVVVICVTLLTLGITDISPGLPGVFELEYLGKMCMDIAKQEPEIRKLGNAATNVDPLEEMAKALIPVQGKHNIAKKYIQ